MISFPDGWPGFGLLLLRLTIAFSSIGRFVTVIASPGTQSIGSWSMALLCLLMGTALLLGILTPVAGAVAALSHVSSCVSWLLASGARAPGGVASTVDLAIMSTVVVLLGPGGFSLDAYFFGRREIIIPEAPRPPHS